MMGVRLFLSSGYILIMLAAFLKSSLGMDCRVCSYSVNTDHSRDCIENPQALNAPANTYTCNRTCVVQENYSIEDKLISSYMRTCSAVDKSGYCVQDTWSIVCFYACLGNMCNDYVGTLHDIYPIRNSDNTGGQSYTEGNGCGNGTFGYSCAQTCGAGCADVCDKVSGHCTCKPGWLGPACVDEDASTATWIVAGAVVGTVCAVALLIIGAFLLIRWIRSRSTGNKGEDATAEAAQGTRTSLSISHGSRPGDDRNLPHSSQLHSNSVHTNSVYEAVEGERNYGYENRTQVMASTDEAKGGPSDEPPSVSSAPSNDQPYEILDHQPETTYDRPQMYQNTLEHHVYNDLKT